MTLKEKLVENKLAYSFAQVRRWLSQDFIRVDDKLVHDEDMDIGEAKEVTVGRRWAIDLTCNKTIDKKPS